MKDAPTFNVRFGPLADLDRISPPANRSKVR
jgi:hypothetical protein